MTLNDHEGPYRTTLSYIVFPGMHEDRPYHQRQTRACRVLRCTDRRV